MKTVVVVDDDENMRDTVADILAMEGYDVHRFSQASEVLPWVEGRSVDLVVTDLNMPDMDGVQLLAALRKAGGHIPVIVLTGAGFEHRAEDVLARGAHACFAKPFDIDVFLNAVSEVLMVGTAREEAS